MRLIDADALKAAIPETRASVFENCHECTLLDAEQVKELIDEAPTVNEAVKPKSKVRHGADAQIQHWCGNCMTMLHGKQKFCSECGREVNWK